VKLLVGLYRPKSGHIYYNGTAEDEAAMEGLRERIGFVTRMPSFSGSIRENLRFVRPDATDEECLQVLRQASVESLLERADKGRYRDWRRRRQDFRRRKAALSIARALLRKPRCWCSTRPRRRSIR
jgi:ATP-binding cassette subfamily B protein